MNFTASIWHLCGYNGLGQRNSFQAHFFPTNHAILKIPINAGMEQIKKSIFLYTIHLLFVRGYSEHLICTTSLSYLVCSFRTTIVWQSWLVIWKAIESKRNSFLLLFPVSFHMIFDSKCSHDCVAIMHTLDRELNRAMTIKEMVMTGKHLMW